MAPRPGRRTGGPGLASVLFYIAVFALVFVGIPALIVSGRPWPSRRKMPEFSIRLFREDLGQVVEMNLEEYLVGVVAGEMPADFHLEALKAQAVAARTYALYRLGLKHNSTNSDLTTEDGAHVSSDFRIGQAWISPEMQRERWGWYGYYQKHRRISTAIWATQGQVLVYGGQPIFAAYHSTSGGATQESGAYFSDLPYLRGVASPGEEISPYHRTTARMAWREVADRLEIDIPSDLKAQLNALPLKGSWEVEIYGSVEKPPDSGEPLTAPAKPISTLAGITEVYPDGRVKGMEILGKTFTGRAVREKLGLRSNWFRVEVEEEGLVFHVQGYGHGVGMSQYGAEAMARRGVSYQDILHHYYTGVQLVKWY